MEATSPEKDKIPVQDSKIELAKEEEKIPE